MNTPDKDWWTAQAGEYVIGTLSQSDWVTFKKAAQHDDQVQQLITDWEHTFQPLADSLEPKQPPDSVWNAIADRVFDLPQHDPTVISLDSHRAVEQQLESKVDRWRTFAGLAAVASIALASLAWLTHLEDRNQEPEVTTATVTQFDSMTIIRDDQSLPLWVVDTALSDGLMRITAVAPPPVDDTKSYQLWLFKPDNSGVQSMGLMPTDANQSYLLSVKISSNEPVAFVVSLEPLGGSPKEFPTGPLLYQGEAQILSL